MICKKKINVLIFPCSTGVGLNINDAIKYRHDINVIGGSGVVDYGKYFYKNYITDIPFYNDRLFEYKLNEILERESIDVIFPTHDDVLVKLASLKLPCFVVGSDFSTNEICRSKSKTYKLLKNKLNVPKEYCKTDELEFPLFVKPEKGSASIGAHRVDDIGGLNFYTNRDPTLLVLEYVPGLECTVDCFTDKEKKLRVVCARTRKKVRGGASVEMEPYYDDRIEEMAAVINNALALRGAWFFQVKQRDDGEWVLMEIAPRIAGGTAMCQFSGINLSLLSIYDAIGKDLDIIISNFEKIEVIRSLQNRSIISYDYEYVYIDLDDTLILDGSKINLMAMMFIYQCLNQEKKIILITKHGKGEEDARRYLNKFRINENLFKSIIFVNKEFKYKYIIEENAIFIDDSAKERLMVSENLKIPVFDVDSIPALIDWRV